MNVNEHFGSQDSEQLLLWLLEWLPLGIFRTNAEGHCIYVNEKWLELTGLSREAALGPNWSSTLHPDDREHVYQEWYNAAHAGREFMMEYRFLTPSGKLSWVSGRAVALRGAEGAITGYVGAIADITDRKRAAEDALRESMLQKELIRLQQLHLEQRSTPLIPITDEILVMPLIGSIDPARGQRVVEALLQGIAGSRARFTVLDITGVSHLDEHAANALIQAAKGVRLVGGQMLISGIQPAVAATLVALGVELSGIVTCSTLQAAIAHAMRGTRGHA